MSVFEEYGIAPIETTGIDDEDVKQKIIEALMEVNDPEIHVDIVNLGLVYEIHMDIDKNVQVKMTLTAMGCPLAGSITGQAAEAVQNVPGVNQANVELVWSPPWDRKRVSKVAAMQLGIR